MSDHMMSLFEKYGVNDTPQARQVYALAWDYGHSSGYSEVELYFDELISIVTDYDHRGERK